MEWMEKKPAGFLRLGYCGRGCPSPSALRHCRRWSFTRWHPLDFLPAWFLSARAHAIRFFRRLFLNDLEKAFDSGRLRFFGSLEKFSCGTLTSFVATSLRCTKPNGSSMPNPLLRDLNKCSITWAATRIAWRFPTIVYRTSNTTRSRFNGRITVTTTDKRR